MFDESWYLQAYPDLARFRGSLLVHFILYGENENRLPNSGFNPILASYRMSEKLLQKRGSIFAKSLRIRPASSLRARLKWKAPQGVLEAVEGGAIRARMNKKTLDSGDFEIKIDGIQIKPSEVTVVGLKNQVEVLLTVNQNLLVGGAQISISNMDGEEFFGSPHSFIEDLNETSGFLELSNNEPLGSVLVVIPIFNAFDAIQDCLESVLRNTPQGVEILVINDASTDPRVQPFLLGLADANQRITLRLNEVNLGYTKNANLGFAEADGRDVVLLNSDTLVPRNWLERLSWISKNTQNAGTVTPLSNSAGVFSTPKTDETNAKFYEWDESQAALQIERAGLGKLPDVPTGNGFCLYITASALSTVGGYDEHKYPRGYGEENDFCLRVRSAGLRNIVTDKVVVIHRTSQSFSDEKFDLMDAGSKILIKDYPDYIKDVQIFFGPEFTYSRARASEAVSLPGSEHFKKRRILYVMPISIGGAFHSHLDLTTSLNAENEIFTLISNGRDVSLHRRIGERQVELCKFKLSVPMTARTHQSDEFDALFANLLFRYSIDIVHVQHLAWSSAGLIKGCKALNVPVVYSAHDFYAACPSLNLLDEKGVFCGGTCTTGSGACNAALWPKKDLLDLKNGFVNTWRARMTAFLEDVDSIVVFSRSHEEIFKKVFPSTASRVTLIPHGNAFPGRTNELPFKNLEEIQKNAKVKILVQCNLGEHKGAKLVGELARLDAGSNFEFHFLGTQENKELASIGVHHGRYRREELPSKLLMIQPHVALVLSTCPETFCYTLSEAWAFGIPAVGLDVGAVGERIRDTGAGWLLEPGSTAIDLQGLLMKAISTGELRDKAMKASQWSITTGTVNTLEWTAAKYSGLYGSSVNKGSSPIMVGMLLPTFENGEPQPTANIRVLSQLKSLEMRAKVQPFICDEEWLLAGGLEELDAVVVQRDASTPKLVSRLKRLKSEQKRTKVIYELDDILWDIPETNEDHNVSSENAENIKALIRVADHVIVSTPRLVEDIAEMGVTALLSETCLDPSLWLAPMSPGYLAEVKSALPEENHKRVLYMGTSSHAEDIELIDFAKFAPKTSSNEPRLYQIGGGLSLAGAKQLEPPSGYYEPFVIWFRAIAANFDYGLIPLKDTDFNARKSNIKFFDYAFAGMAVACSDIAVYRDIDATGDVVDFVMNDQMAWKEFVIKIQSEEVAALKHKRVNVIELAKKLTENRKKNQQLTEILAGLHEESGLGTDSNGLRR